MIRILELLELLNFPDLPGLPDPKKPFDPMDPPTSQTSWTSRTSRTSRTSPTWTPMGLTDPTDPADYLTLFVFLFHLSSAHCDNRRVWRPAASTKARPRPVSWLMARDTMLPRCDQDWNGLQSLPIFRPSWRKITSLWRKFPYSLTPTTDNFLGGQVCDKGDQI